MGRERGNMKKKKIIKKKLIKRTYRPITGEYKRWAKTQEGSVNADDLPDGS